MTATKDRKHILISGAGIAGPALALLLTRLGHKCTIVEKAPDFRESGQQIDVAGEALKVLDCMDAREDCFKCRVEDDGIKFIYGPDEQVAARFPASSNAGALVKELEIMRPDLARVFYEETREDVQYVFDDYITDLEQQEGSVTVTFAKSAPRTFDLLVAADGLRSKTRTLAFGEGNTEIVGFNLFAAYFSIPWQESDGSWSRWYNAPGGRCVTVRPNITKGLTSAYLCQVTPDAAYVCGLSPEERNRELHSRFKDAGFEAPRILKYLNGPEGEDLYIQEAAQSKCQRLVKGRAVLMGDAGYCPSPFSGQGSSLALIGAYILAGCIATHDDLDEALAEYEKTVRPFVTAAQKLPPGVPWIVNPQTATGITIMNQLLKVADKVVNWGVAGAVGRLVSPVFSWVGTSEPTLPEYPQLNR